MLVKFTCNNPECNNEITKLFKSKLDIPPFLDCGDCGSGKLERQLSAPSTKSTQIVDNGMQARQVEVMNEVVLKQEEKVKRESSNND